ncbi:alpha-N-arabinofuranosidase [Butyrivibrio sp. AC2005]|uniref:alpha-N-arabinofuranosidase n=1 Tax=Butyrivibrio sp. AC2005 TaxID=1280672 RepID=UPI0003FFDA4B|nr:alpha-L-arabinofuranosidase C-terminal domain-containing protein [Butyrivibrio sp. AC2005]
MKTVKTVVNKNFQKGNISPLLFGSFAEHMGRVIYTGIYEPDNKLADEDGFRKDVLSAVKESGISVVRYPGGNFVSTYCWEDGVGPREKRPVRLDPAWRSIETNQFGTDEFMKWVKKAGVEPMLAVNLGTRGIEEAIRYLEYCNIPSGSTCSNMRIENGIKDSYDVKYWCLGNEMDGKWQVGHKTAYEYGRLAAETSKAMKAIDPGVKTILCGSSLSSMPTFPDWEIEALDLTYDFVDYISLHQYYGGQDKGTEAFLSQADNLADFIDTVASVIKVTKAKKRSKHDIQISLDEWGVWTRPSENTVEESEAHRWQIAPAISEMIYSFQDALLFSGMLMMMIKKSDIVKLACQSLIANISSMIMTEKDGGLWYQTIYEPFKYMASHSRGTVLEEVTDDHSGMLQAVTLYNSDDGCVYCYAINRSINEKIELNLDLQGFEAEKIVEHVQLHHKDVEATNEKDHDNVRLEKVDESAIIGGNVVINLESLSWNGICIKVTEK